MSEKQILGECPFCIADYPEGQEFCRTEKITRDGSSVFAWEVSYCCGNCGTLFSVAEDSVSRPEEEDLRKSLKIGK